MDFPESHTILNTTALIPRPTMGIRCSKPKPHPHDSCQYTKTGQAIHSGMVTVCDESRASNCSAGSNSNHRGRFVPHKPKQRSGSHCGQVLNVIWLEKTSD